LRGFSSFLRHPTRNNPSDPLLGNSRSKCRIEMRMMGWPECAGFEFLLLFTPNCQGSRPSGWIYTHQTHRP
jgi:hypothetical protein